MAQARHKPPFPLFRLAVIALSLCTGMSFASAKSLHGVVLPGGSRLQPDGSALVNSNFRKSLRHLERFLKRRKILHRQIPTYEVRGVLIARFVSQTPITPWEAIQLYKSLGKTHIFVVPRAENPPKP